MFVSRKVEEEIKMAIIEGYNKEDILEEVKKKHGQLQGINLFYDCCYNTICKQLGINRKRGEELKPKKVKIRFKKGK